MIEKETTGAGPKTRWLSSLIGLCLVGLCLVGLCLVGLCLPASAAAQGGGTTIVLPMDVAGAVRGRYAIRANRSLTESAAANPWLVLAEEGASRPASCLREASCLAEAGRELGRARVVGLRMSAAGDDFRVAVLVVASANGQTLAEQSFTFTSRELVTDAGPRIVSTIAAAPAGPSLEGAAATPPETHVETPPETHVETPHETHVETHVETPHEIQVETHAAVDHALDHLEEHHEGQGAEVSEPVRDTGEVPETLAHSAFGGEPRELHVEDEEPLTGPEPEREHIYTDPGGPWTPGWLITTGGALLTLVGLGVGAYSLLTYNACVADPCTEREIRDAQNVALGADILIFGGLGTAALGVLLAYALGEEEHPHRRSGSSEASLGASLSCGPSGCAASLRLSF